MLWTEREDLGGGAGSFVWQVTFAANLSRTASSRASQFRAISPRAETRPEVVPATLSALENVL